MNVREIKPLPPDDPIFSLGVSFVFKHELPEDEHEHQDENEREDD